MSKDIARIGKLPPQLVEAVEVKEGQDTHPVDRALAIILSELDTHTHTHTTKALE